MSAQENNKVPNVGESNDPAVEVKDLTGKEKFIKVSLGKQEAIIAAIGVAVGVGLSFLISRIREVAEEEHTVEVTTPSVSTSKS